MFSDDDLTEEEKAKIHKQFLVTAKGAKAKEAFIERWLNERGFKTTRPRKDHSPTFDQRGSHGDKVGDIIIHLPDSDLLVEVKKSSSMFTCAQDYPYPRYLINDINKHKRYRPYIYYNINREGSHMAIILGLNGGQRSWWYVEDIVDSRYKVKGKPDAKWITPTLITEDFNDITWHCFSTNKTIGSSKPWEGRKWR